MPGILLHSREELTPNLAALVRLLDPACSPVEAREHLRTEGVLEAARAHGVAMLLNQRWSGLIASELPSKVAAEWTAVCRATAVRTLRQHAHATRLLAALGEAGVETLPLRGLWLAEAMYGDPSLRPSQDVDLWVAPEQLGDAAAVLRATGMVPVEGEASEGNREPVPGPPEFRTAAGAWGLATPEPHDWRLWVDVHVTLHISSHGWWPFWPPYQWLRERAEPWPAMGSRTLQPRLPLALLVQADNIVRHALARRAHHDRLLGYYDAALIVRNMPPAGWLQVVEDARQLRLGLHLAALLLTVERLWQVSAPQDVIPQLRRQGLSWRVGAWALKRPRLLGHLPRGALFQTCAMRSPAEAGRYVLRNIEPGLREMLKS